MQDKMWALEPGDLAPAAIPCMTVVTLLSLQLLFPSSVKQRCHLHLKVLKRLEQMFPQMCESAHAAIRKQAGWAVHSQALLPHSFRGSKS